MTYKTLAELMAAKQARETQERIAAALEKLAAVSPNTVWQISDGSSTTSSALTPDGERVATGSGGVTGYLLADLHGNQGAVVNAGESAIVGATRYDPYGLTAASYSGSGSVPTPWRYQGRLDVSANPADPLYVAGARDYLPATGTFISVDSFPGDIGNPASLNRYLYAAANPTSLIDPSGHYFQKDYDGGGGISAPDPGQLVSVAGTDDPSKIIDVVAVLAFTLLAPLAIEAAAGFLATTWSWGATGWTAAGGGWAGAAGAVSGACYYACNPIAATIDAIANPIPTSPWNLGWSQRGFAIEERLGANLMRNYPVIDRFESGVATSIKSINLAAPTYQNASRLQSRLTTYVDQLAEFSGRRWGPFNIQSNNILSRELVVAIPPTAPSATQSGVLDWVISYAADEGITVRYVVVP